MEMTTARDSANRKLGQLNRGGLGSQIHHQAAGLVAKDAVHAGDGLHETVAMHRLVGIHRVQGSGGKCFNLIQKMAAHVVAIVSDGFPPELLRTQCVASANTTRHKVQQIRDTLGLP
jgi:hypothetical protein